MLQLHEMTKEALIKKVFDFQDCISAIEEVVNDHLNRHPQGGTIQGSNVATGGSTVQGSTASHDTTAVLAVRACINKYIHKER